MSTQSKGLGRRNFRRVAKLSHIRLEKTVNSADLCPAPAVSRSYPNQIFIPSGPREMAAMPVRDTSTRPNGCISEMN